MSEPVTRSPCSRGSAALVTDQIKNITREDFVALFETRPPKDSKEIRQARREMGDGDQSDSEDERSDQSDSEDERSETSDYGVVADLKKFLREHIEAIGSDQDKVISIGICNADPIDIEADLEDITGSGIHENFVYNINGKLVKIPFSFCHNMNEKDASQYGTHIDEFKEYLKDPRLVAIVASHSIEDKFSESQQSSAGDDDVGEDGGGDGDGEE